MRRSVLTLSLLAALPIAALGPERMRYSLKDLGISGWGQATFLRINRHGEIAGTRRVHDLGRAVHRAVNFGGFPPGDYSFHAFLYSKGKVIDLGSLGGGFSQATGINASGEVVGLSDTVKGERHAFLYSKGKMRDLGTLGGTESEAGGINDLGQIVGWSQTAGGKEHVFLYMRGKMTDLGTLGVDRAHPHCINDSGQFAGAYRKNGACQPFLYAAGKLHDIGALDDNGAREINRSGLVVGDGFISHGKAGMILKDFWAFGVNASGQIVGALKDGREDGCLFAGGKLTNLNHLLDASGAGWVIHCASAINDAGQVVAEARNRKTDRVRAVLLTPVRRAKK